MGALIILLTFCGVAVVIGNTSSTLTLAAMIPVVLIIDADRRALQRDYNALAERVSILEHRQ